MKLTSILVAMLGILSISPASPLSSQSASDAPVRFGILGGATKPVGDLSAYADLDWNAGALLSFGRANSPVRFRVDGQWQQINGRRFTLGRLASCVGCPYIIQGTDYRVLDATANIVYSVAIAAPTQLYLMGGLGVYNQRATDVSNDVNLTRTRFGINGGAGISFHLFHVATFIEVRYHDIIQGGAFGSFGNVYGRPQTFQILPISVGVVF